MIKKVSDFDVICEPLFALKGIKKSTSYGTPAIKFKDKLLVRLKEDNTSIVIIVNPEDRDLLLRDKPEVYFLTDHYLNYPSILARLAFLHPDELFALVQKQWRRLGGGK
jgi:hypothetical protein